MPPISLITKVVAMIDIRDYPGVLDRVNYILSGGEEAELKVEEDGSLRVARHTRVYMGKFGAGCNDPVKPTFARKQE